MTILLAAPGATVGKVHLSVPLMSPIAGTVVQTVATFATGVPATDAVRLPCQLKRAVGLPCGKVSVTTRLVP